MEGRGCRTQFWKGPTPARFGLIWFSLIILNGSCLSNISPLSRRGKVTLIVLLRHSLYKTNTLSLMFIVLAHWNNSSAQVDIFLLGNIVLFIQFLLLLGGKVVNTNLLVFGLTRSGIEPTIFRTQSECVNHHVHCTRQSQVWFYGA